MRRLAGSHVIPQPFDGEEDDEDIYAQTVMVKNQPKVVGGFGSTKTVTR